MTAAADVIVVGSGFGGSVTALRLAERGHRVTVLEQGRRLDRAALAATSESPRALTWAPRLGLYGPLSQRVFRDVAILSGVGVGGGSLVYGGVLLEPAPALFDEPAWQNMDVAWARELAPHYATAARMLGRTDAPHRGSMDGFLGRAAAAVGAAASFGPTPVGVYFGEPNVEHPDPYFDGRGPSRRGCVGCGRCLAGCPHGAKNTLDLNYLHLAEQRGARCVPDARVDCIVPLPGGGFRVYAADTRTGRPHPPRSATHVVLAAGAVGTVELLLRCRDYHRTLPALSRTLGHGVRTNAEAIVGIAHRRPPADLADGVAISSHFFPDERTHITQNRLAPAQSLLRLAATPMVDDAQPWRRTARTLAAMMTSPRRMLALWGRRDFTRAVTVLTVMQRADEALQWHWQPTRRGGRLASRAGPGPRPPAYLPIANRVARALADASDGIPFSLSPESVGNRSITAHILGGCALAAGPDAGVVDARHEAFGYPGLFVVDGAALPANIGVNPSLTIAALAERCASLFPTAA